ncbi:MAG TPA: winged helix-turn-helix transcriptional regulator [Candidatus Saccharimonadales bacterium]|nr:winged helix-turn-helix transcriptional regulator [Candidatus Saccharimonadales bacterium]
MITGLVLGFALGLAIGLAVNKNPEKEAKKHKDRAPDEADTKKILSLFKRKKKIQNNDVEKLLKVSDSTATRYLERLEQRGKVTQKGSGRGTFYTKNT